MSLINIQPWLLRAQREHFALGAFNMNTLEQAQAIVAAAEQERALVIIQISQRTLEYVGIGNPTLGLRYLARIGTIAADRDRERRRQVQSKEDRVVELVRTAMRHLRLQGKSVTQKGISQMVGKTVNGLRHYPRVKVILRVVAEECRHVRKMKRESRESGWVDKVERAIEKLKRQGRPITYREISRQIHSSASSLLRYPRIKAILKKVSARGNRQGRESELLTSVWEAKRGLTAKEKPVTQMAISKEVKMSPSGLRGYPRIRAILAQMINERRNRMRANRKAVQ